MIATTTTTAAAPASVNVTTKSSPSRTNSDRTEETAPVATPGAYWAVRLRGPAAAPEWDFRADLFWYIRRSAFLTSAS